MGIILEYYTIQLRHKGETIDIRLIWGLVIILILFFILIVNTKKRTKAERAAVQARVKLKESYVELEKAYDEVTATKNALYSRYEELKVNRDKIKKLAYSDFLTELPNRVAFLEMLDAVLLMLKPEDTIGLMDIDLDNFKHINDTLGHSYGDELLIEVTKRLREVLGEADYLARIGGDEFAILTKTIKDPTAYEEKIREVQKSFTYPFIIGMKEFFVTVSIGVALSPKDGTNSQTLIKNMDAAMYVAKEKGKNNHCFFDHSINLALMKKIEMQTELRRAVEERQFVVYYQSQMDLDTDRIVGFEALARWIHPEKGVIPPLDFIPIAEENGLIVKIGKIILEDACWQLRQWEEAGYDDIVMAVNISARQFKDKDFLDTVYEVLENTKVNPKLLEFEITESVALDDIEFTIEMITKLKEVGVSFALDDFGTGYSSLNYLKRIPVENLKIDKSFLDTVLDNTCDKKIVETMIDLAKTLNIKVIAEGVEKTEQAMFLKYINCDKAQGYLYSKPVPREEACMVLDKVNHKLR